MEAWYDTILDVLEDYDFEREYKAADDRHEYKTASINTDGR
jgi:hypothetical protein